MSDSVEKQLVIPAVTVLPPKLNLESQITDLEAAISHWLGTIVGGKPRLDTVKGYRQEMDHWLRWCDVNAVDPRSPARINVEAYRMELIAAKLLSPTIARKLTVVRLFYEWAKNTGFILRNPAAGIKAPPDERIKRTKKLSHGQAERLLEALPPSDTLRGKRDRLILGLLLLEGLRRVELERANDEDLEEAMFSPKILVHGKKRDRYKFPRADTLAAWQTYVALRGEVEQDMGVLHGKETLVTPLICNIDKGGSPRGRISRRGLNYIVDGYMEKAGVKQDQFSCHSLRHTFATLLYHETKDLKAVQDELGHKWITTSAIYADSDYERERYSERVPLGLK